MGDFPRLLLYGKISESHLARALQNQDANSSGMLNWVTLG